MNQTRRPDESFSIGLQHERTALAWERTAIALIIAGVAQARFGSINDRWLFAGFGLVQVAFGAAVLVWAGIHYEDLHGALRSGDDIVHPRAVQLVGAWAVAGTGLALVAGILAVGLDG